MAADFQHRPHDPGRAEFSDAFMEMFRVVIQLGAILAVVVLYFRKLSTLCVQRPERSGFSPHIRWPVMHLWFKIIAACLPAAACWAFCWTTGLTRTCTA